MAFTYEVTTSPVLKYKDLSGNVLRIPLFSQQDVTVPGVVAWLTYGVQLDPQSSTITKYYIPLVPNADASASGIKIQKNGSKLAIRTPGYTVVPANQVMYEVTHNPLASPAFVTPEFTVSKYKRNIVGEEGINFNWSIRGGMTGYSANLQQKVGNSWVVIERFIANGKWPWEPVRAGDSYPRALESGTYKLSYKQIGNLDASWQYFTVTAYY